MRVFRLQAKRLWLARAEQPGWDWTATKAGVPLRHVSDRSLTQYHTTTRLSCEALDTNGGHVSLPFPRGISSRYLGCCSSIKMRFKVLLACVCSIFFTTAAAILPSAPILTATMPQCGQLQQALTTPAPSLPTQHEYLKKREGAHNTCGYSGIGTDAYTVSCYDEDSYCVASILHDGHAYMVCSTSGAVTQTFATTAYGNWSGSSCPSSALCWYVSPVLEAQIEAEHL